MTDEAESKFDLAERTANFAEQVIETVQQLSRNAVTTPLIKQVVRSGTSIGANYVEADEAGSKKEFQYRISLCKRESKETQYWLRMLAKAVPQAADEFRILWKETNELTRIFAAIHRRSKENDQ